LKQELDVMKPVELTAVDAYEYFIYMRHGEAESRYYSNDQSMSAAPYSGQSKPPVPAFYAITDGLWITATPEGIESTGE
jgi:hypothetical protein